MNKMSRDSPPISIATHPELATERYKNDRAAIERTTIAKGESEVARFLQTVLHYQPTYANKSAMLKYLHAHNLPLTAESLMQAFNALKPTLAQSDKGVSYGSTTVVDFGPRRENPSYITKELKESTRRKVARMSSAQYRQWCLDHPDDAAIMDEE